MWWVLRGGGLLSNSDAASRARTLGAFPVFDPSNMLRSEREWQTKAAYGVCNLG